MLEKPRRKATRLSGYDYSQSGAYFVTVCTHKRKAMLGTVIEDQVMLSPEGKVVQSIWAGLPEHYSHIELDAFVIMPNHVHGIIWIKNDAVGEGLRPSPTEDAKTKRHGLSEIVRALKSFSARTINEQNHTVGQPFWQRSFYDHILRDEKDLHAYRKYILENQLK